MANVKLQNVTKVYDNNVLGAKDINIDIKDGEFVILVGPSGCGKTTILRMIAGLETITDGKVSIGERVVNDLMPKNRNVSMVFQNYALYPHMTVRDNLSFGLRIQKINKKEIEKRISWAVEVLGIEKLLKRKPKELSGGQRQRVAVGRSIVRKPDVFLFDEPLSNLDAKMRVEMRSELLGLHNRLKATMIYVTHDQVEAMTMGDKIVVLKDGEIQQIAHPIELYRKPDNKFVAGFIGSPPMNFIDGEINIEDGKSYFVNNQIHIDISDKYKNIKPNKCTLGIRPEDIIDSEIEETDNSTNQMIAKIKIVEMLGNDAIIHFKYDNNNFKAIVDLLDKYVYDADFKFVFKKDRIFLFDNDGRTIG
ncbi:sn-glycerol-3-phosphate ABC transporter ATP-binding protein UgpC [candidate division WOR-3 bacterium]|nr:sn-glycerol-3-phosphate ABC transporter ATP-binding protein UgpC [candidate division WOR-3 bacterium]